MMLYPFWMLPALAVPWWLLSRGGPVAASGVATLILLGLVLLTHLWLWPAWTLVR